MSKDKSKLLEKAERGSMIQVYRNYGTQEEVMYLSKLVSIVDGKAIIVAPIIKGVLVPFSITIDYKFHLFLPDNKIIGSDARFLKVAKKDVLNLAVFELVGDVSRVQRRNFLRLATEMPIRFKRHTLHASPNYEGVILNLGGGGIRLVAKESIDHAEILKFNIPLDSENITVIGKVLHKKHLDAKSLYTYEYRIQFEDIPAITQEKIVAYIFEKQREALARV